MYNALMVRRKNSVQEALNDTDSLISNLKDVFNQMADARSKGDIAEYINSARSIRNSQEELEDKLEEISDEHFSIEVEEQIKQMEDITGKSKPEEPAPKTELLPEPVAQDPKPEIQQYDPKQMLGPVPQIESGKIDPQQRIIHPYWTKGVKYESGDPESGQVDLSVYQGPLPEDTGPSTERSPVVVPQTATASRVGKLIVNAKKAISDREKRLAAVLLSRASEMCEELGAIRQSDQLIMVVKDLLNEQG
jgi:hypothetical protein